MGIRPPVVALMLFAWACGCSVARGQLDQPDATKTYQHIWECTDEELWEAVVELRASAPVWRPERAASKLLTENLDVVERLSDATRIQPTPPGAAPADPWSASTSEIRNYRRTAYLFSVDATRLLAEGDADDAAGRVASILRLTRQLALEPRMTSMALAVSCVELVDEQIGEVAGAASLTDVGRREILVALLALDEADPAGFKRGLSGALRIGEWIREHFNGDDAGERLIASLPIPEERKRAVDREEAERFDGRGMGRRRGGGRRGGMWPSRQLIAELRALDGQGMRDAAAEFEKMINEAVGAWDRPDAEEVLSRLEMNAERGAYGPLARLLPQGLPRHRRTAERVGEAVERIRLTLMAR